MQSGIVPRIRQLHEDIEQHRGEITQQLVVQPKNFRHELLINHFIYARANLISLKSEELLQLYEDEDFETAKAQKLTVGEAMRDFEAGVASIREYHRSHAQPPIRAALAEPSIDDNLVVFSTDERHGRCMVLQEHYGRYMAFFKHSAVHMNKSTKAKNVETELSYEDFIRALPTLTASIPCARKVASLQSYDAFVVGLLSYLEGFFNRVRPLHKTHVAAMVKDTVADFPDAWAKGTVPGWDRALCGDSPEARRCAMTEAFIERYLALLVDVLAKTVDFCEQKLTKTVEEIEREMEEEEAKVRSEYELAVANFHKTLGTTPEVAPVADAAEADTNDIDETKFTKKNFPVDEFGNPIPVWLYHLHGLHIKYYCEICTYTYYGEKNYVQHFTEPRHLQGLQRIGISECPEALKLISTRDAALKAWAKVCERVAGEKNKRSGAFVQYESVSGMVVTGAK